MKIVKNTTVSPYSLSDVGITIPASSSYQIPPADYLLWAASDEVITGIGSGDLVINDGSSDLSINEGSKYIQGIFPNPVGIAAGTDGTAIGHVGDRLKVDTADASDAIGAPVFSPAFTWDLSISNTALTASYQTLYSYSGNGKFIGANLLFQNAKQVIKVTIDGSIILETDVGNIELIQINGANSVASKVGLWWANGESKLGVHPAYPIEFTSSVSIEAKNSPGFSGTAKGHVVAITKES